LIKTINHIGIGVSNMRKSKELLKDMGFRIKINDSTYRIWELKELFGHNPLMRISNWMHPYTGPVLELFQHRLPAPEGEIKYNCPSGCGLSEMGILVARIDEIAAEWSGKHQLERDVYSISFENGREWKAAEFRTVEGLRIQMIETEECTSMTKGVLGISHVGITVADMDSMGEFYSEILGFDEVQYEKSNGKSPVEDRPRWLSKSEKDLSPISAYNGGIIKLIPLKDNFTGQMTQRRFGSEGVSEIGLEVSQIMPLYESLRRRGARGVVSPLSFSRPFGPKGKLAYLMDPEGNVIELVELQSVFHMPLSWLEHLMIRPLKKTYTILFGNRRK